MHTFELILQKNNITDEEWRQLVLNLSSSLKGFRPFTLVVAFNKNLLRYFVLSKRDLSEVSTGIEGIIIVPAREEDELSFKIPEDYSRIGFLKIPTEGTLIDLKERYKLQEGLDLKAVHLEVQCFPGKRLMTKMKTYFTAGQNNKVSIQQLALFPSHLLKIDFSSNTSYLKKSTPRYLNIEKTLHSLSTDSANAIFSVNAFPYLSQNCYINLYNYEFDKHSFIIGSSGSGKSKLIELLVDRMSKINVGVNYRVVVIDPHAALAKDFEGIPSSRIINFSGESTQLFPDAQSDISASTELTTTLFKSLVSDDNSSLERVLRFTLYVLYVAQSMSLQMLKTFLTDIDTRNQILGHVKGYVPENIQIFFGSDFNEIRTKRYNESILPIVSLIDEMQMQPSLVGESEQSLAKTIQENFLTVFSLNKVSMGEKVVKTVAGLLIQQIFLLAQARAFSQKVILIIDEVSIIQNPALAQILAEARKFNLTVILTQQYFGQIEKDLHDSILSNVVNYYVFKVSEEDARNLEGNLEIQLPDEILAEAKEKGLKEADVRAKIMVELDPRDCLIRLSSGGQVLPCMLARTMDAPVREFNAGSSTENLEPFKRSVLPPKFDLAAVNQSADMIKKDLETFDTAPVLSTTENVAKTIGQSAVDNSQYSSYGSYRPLESYGRSLHEILAKHSSRGKKPKE